MPLYNLLANKEMLLAWASHRAQHLECVFYELVKVNLPVAHSLWAGYTCRLECAFNVSVSGWRLLERNLPVLKVHYYKP